jgi:hypothetical protein
MLELSNSSVPGGIAMNPNATYRTGIYAAILLIAGTLLSGPAGLIVVAAVQPQPPWQDAPTLAANYHPIQTFPFFAGFLLVIGSGLLVAVLYQLAEAKDKAMALLAVICTAAFMSLIFFNYICQTTFLPVLLMDYRPEYDAVVMAFAFTNGRSLCWAIEMWGYALLGLATWLLAPIFNRNWTEKTTAWLMVLNGVLSIAGGFITAMDLSWVMTTTGMINYIAWNALIVLWGVFVILSLLRREREQRLSVPHLGLDVVGPAAG